MEYKILVKDKDRINFLESTQNTDFTVEPNNQILGKKGVGGVCCSYVVVRMSTTKYKHSIEYSKRGGGVSRLNLHISQGIHPIYY